MVTNGAQIRGRETSLLKAFYIYRAADKAAPCRRKMILIAHCLGKSLDAVTVENMGHIGSRRGAVTATLGAGSQGRY